MTAREPAARLRASLVRALRELRQFPGLPPLSRAELEAMLQDAAAMGELELLGTRAGVPGVASALAALAVGLVGGSAQLQATAGDSPRLSKVGPDG